MMHYLKLVCPSALVDDGEVYMYLCIYMYIYVYISYNLYICILSKYTYIYVCLKSHKSNMGIIYM